MFIDVTFSEPHQNLEFDDFLLSVVKNTPILRIWESSVFFVVMGRNSPPSDVNWSACERDSIPVLRRNSGGGTILQGPGCLNYTLVLSTSISENCRTIQGAFNFVLGKVLSALKDLMPQQDLQIRGRSDLCLGDRKFSGNAQRRKGSYLYVHGTILYNFPIEIIPLYLTIPKNQPAYRNNRPHTDFLTNLSVDRYRIVRNLQQEWQ